MSETAEQKRRWRIIDLLKWTSEHLEEKKFDNPRLTAERLLGHVLGLRRVELYLQYDRLLTRAELESFKILLKRRLRHEPLQYVLGETEFFGLRLKVSPAVLIPRPETEVLVEQVIDWVGRLFGKESPIELLDVGTGSGNIAVALAHHLPGARVTALDVSPEALSVARENVSLNAVEGRVRLVEADFVEFARQAVASAERFEGIVSNPPYVSATEFENLAPEIREHEPRRALMPAGEPLGFFRALAEWALRLLKPGGFIGVEVGFGQAGSVRSIFEEHGLVGLQVHRDLSGIERVVLASAAEQAGISRPADEVHKESVIE